MYAIKKYILWKMSQMNWRLSLAGKYRLEPEAKQDLKESVLWYEKQQEGVDKEN